MKSVAIAMLGFVLAAIGVTVPVALAIKAGELSPYGAIILMALNVGGFGIFWAQIAYAMTAEPETKP